MKRCGRCEKTKAKSAFSKRTASKDGLASQCKKCKREYQRSPKQREAQRRYRKTQASKDALARYRQGEKGQASGRTYRQSPRGKALRRAAKQRYRQGEKGQATQRAYRRSESRKEAQRKYAQSDNGKRTAKKAYSRHFEKYPLRKGAHLAISHAIEYGRLPSAKTLVCAYCGSQARHYHHHKGYTKKHWLAVVPLCINCHTKAHA